MRVGKCGFSKISTFFNSSDDGIENKDNRWVDRGAGHFRPLQRLQKLQIQ